MLSFKLYAVKHSVPASFQRRKYPVLTLTPKPVDVKNTSCVHWVVSHMLAITILDTPDGHKSMTQRKRPNIVSFGNKLKFICMNVVL